MIFILSSVVNAYTEPMVMEQITDEKIKVQIDWPELGVRLSNIFITQTGNTCVEVISIKIDKKIKERMRKLAHVNWSEIIRRAIVAKVVEEETKSREIDRELLREAARITDKIRETTKAAKGWDSTEEIRKWRELRR